MDIFALPGDFTKHYLAIVENATAEERATAMDRFGNSQRPDILQVSEDGKRAVISVTGVLTPNGPSPIARFFGFGGTAYNDITAAADLMAEDPTITDVAFNFDTPGGMVKGMDDARQAIERLVAKKSVTAYNNGRIESAGYYLASAIPQIVATSPLAKTGSIGVVIAGVDTSKAMEGAGVKQIKILSKNAPNKQPDPTTERGITILQAEVDATERVFIDKVAQGRGVTSDEVIAKFGQGASLIADDPDPDAEDALSAGMIDSVQSAFSSPAGDGGDGMSAGPTTFRDFPMVNQPWDSAQAVQRVRRFVGATDAPNQRYRQAFFWFDSGNTENFGAYKLPFVDVVDGRLVAVVNGVNAANGAMNGAGGNRVQIPNADRPRVQAHIDKYREKWQRQQKNSRSAMGGGLSPVLNQEKETAIMDRAQLKAEYPALYDEVVGIGVTQERERVDAHLSLGKASGDMEFAMSCVSEGKELTPTVNAKYLAAQMNNQASAARTAESVGDLETPPADTNGDTQDAALAAELADRLGVEINA